MAKMKVAAKDRGISYEINWLIELNKASEKNIFYELSNYGDQMVIINKKNIILENEVFLRSEIEKLMNEGGFNSLIWR